MPVVAPDVQVEVSVTVPVVTQTPIIVTPVRHLVWVYNLLGVKVNVLD